MQIYSYFKHLHFSICLPQKHLVASQHSLQHTSLHQTGHLQVCGPHIYPSVRSDPIAGWCANRLAIRFRIALAASIWCRGRKITTSPLQLEAICEAQWVHLVKPIGLGYRAMCAEQRKRVKTRRTKEAQH